MITYKFCNVKRMLFLRIFAFLIGPLIVMSSSKQFSSSADDLATLQKSYVFYSILHEVKFESIKLCCILAGLAPSTVVTKIANIV